MGSRALQEPELTLGGAQGHVLARHRPAGRGCELGLAAGVCQLCQLVNRGRLGSMLGAGMGPRAVIVTMPALRRNST